VMAVTDPAACHGVWLPLLEPLLQRPVDYNREFGRYGVAF
jgi:hypothetical protein